MKPETWEALMIFFSGAAFGLALAADWVDYVHKRRKK